MGGIAQRLYGVRAAGKQLEDIAEPLTAVDAEPGARDDEGEDRAQPATEQGARGDEDSARRAAQERIRERRERRQQRERSGFVATDQAREDSPRRASLPVRYSYPNRSLTIRS